MTIYYENTARKPRDLPVSEAERAARVQLAACYRVFNHLGWVEMIFNHITLRVPDINESNFRFEPVDSRTIRYGLGGIKGTGEAAINSIIEARKAGAYQDLFDFCHRVDKRLVNRRAIEAMARAGAFDCIEANRASLLASVGLAMEAAEQDERQASQESLFGDPSESRGAAFRPACAPGGRYGAAGGRARPAPPARCRRPARAPVARGA